MNLIHASAENATFIKLVSITRIPDDPEPRPTTSTKSTDAAIAASADTEPKDIAQGSKDQPPLEGRQVQEGDGMQQEESEDLKDTSRGKELTEEVTIEEVVASTTQQVIPEGNDNEHHPPPSPPPPPPPPPRQPSSSESTTAVVVIAVAALSQMSIGATLIWPHVLLPQLAMRTTTFLNTELYLSRNLADLADYLLLAGLATVLAPSGWMVARLGRRRSLVAAILWSIVSWALHALATDALLFLLGRFIAGLSTAMLKVSVTTYVTEVMVVSGRGLALVCLEIMKITGALICLSLNLLLPWYHIAFVNLAWMVACGVAAFFFPESPAYLVMQKREEEAHSTLQRLRGSGCNVEEELQIIKSHNTSEKANAKFSSLFRKPLISHMMELVGLSVVSVFSGSAVMVTSGADMMLEGGYWGRKDMTIVLVLLSLVSGSFFLISFVDRIGRRPCLLVSLMILVLTYSGLGAISYVAPVTPGPTQSTAWIIVRNCLILVTAFSLTLGTHTVPTILAAEYFPAYCRPQGLAVFFTASVLLQTLSLHVQPLIEDKLGLHNLYWLFGMMALLGIIYTNFCVYEIKYKMHRLSATCHWLYKENFYYPRPLI